jgi:Rieske Fe-S protein
MRRREFVESLPVIGPSLVLGTSALSLGACAGVRYVAPRMEAGGLVVLLAELDVEGHLFVHPPGMQRPVYVRRLAGGEIVALLAACTHAGCQPEPVADRLACPCHGSEFSFEGDVLQGPAERPLTRYPVSVEGDRLVVALVGGSP